MKRILVPLTIAATLISGSAMASDSRVCSIIGDIGGNAAMMRQAGATQQETARAGSNYFSGVINSPEMRSSYTNEERRVIAQSWGHIATRIVQTVYSLPIEKTAARKDVAVRATAEWAFETCMKNG